MNVICTGGAGFIGSHLVKKLSLDDKISKIYILDNLIRTNGLRNLNNSKKIEFICADISHFDYSYFDEIPISKVYHLASPRINRCVKFNTEGHDSIVNGGFNIVKFCHKKYAKLFFASTASVYNKPEKFPIDENDPTNPHTIYGAGKLYIENLIKSYDQMYGFDHIINRFFSVYGPKMDCEGPYTEVIFNWLNKLKFGNNITVYGDPTQKILDLVYVSDVIDAIQITMKKSNKEIFNVSTEVGISLHELIKIIENVVEKKINVDIKNDTRMDIEKKRIGSTKKLKRLGWKRKITLERGIRRTWEWIRHK